MARWQFSLSDALIGTAVIAIWVWIILLFPFIEGAPPYFIPQVIPLVALFLLTLTLHRLTRDSPKAWLMAALWAGLTILGAVFLVALNDDPRILIPFR
jgi:hypothetical protein